MAVYGRLEYRSCAKACNWRGATELLQEMEACGIVPNVTCGDSDPSTTKTHEYDMRYIADSEKCRKRYDTFRILNIAKIRQK